MKKIYLTFSAVLVSALAVAQTEFTFTPSELDPHPEGFYIGGETYTWDGAPSEFFANGCPGEVINGREIDPEDYERRDPFNVTYDLHNETGEQQGFSYYNAMILPDCNQKYIGDEEQIDPQVATGFIQLHPSIDSNTDDVKDEDSLKLSYIQSPLLSNLQSMTVETSADISIQQDRRYIPYLVEVSLDSGASWELIPYIQDEVSVRSGYRAVYDESNLDFKDMMDFSTEQNVMLRLISNFDDPDLEAYKGQYVNVHKITIMADSAKAADPVDETVLSSVNLEENPIKLEQRRIFIEEGKIHVYSFSGQYFGNGKSVTVTPGLFVVTTETGIRKKVLVR